MEIHIICDDSGIKRPGRGDNTEAGSDPCGDEMPAGGNHMDNPNKSIECSVEQCRYHCSDCNYCSLDKIMGGTHEADPETIQCGDCMSFRSSVQG